ncbi:MAG: hypothetical protein EBT09_06190, partial [Actinobacteria bacterium]|nr:hypothetical protein [Actinomycetota bacterium]
MVRRSPETVGQPVQSVQTSTQPVTVLLKAPARDMCVPPVRVGSCTDIGMRHVNQAPAQGRWCDLGSRGRPLPGWAHRRGTLPSRA